jgi:hypothetical protein
MLKLKLSKFFSFMFIAVIFALSSSVVLAATKNAIVAAKPPLENCAIVKQIDGESCSSLTVQFDVSRCGDPLRFVQAKVICDAGNSDAATVTYRSGKFDYRGRIVVKRRWWGGPSWEPSGDISRARRAPEANVVSRPTTPEAAPLSRRPPVDAILDMPRSTKESLRAEQEAEQEAQDKNDKLLSFLTELTVKGSVDLYYATNFNGPPPISAVPTSANNQAQNVYRVFDTAHDSFQFSYAHLMIEKPAGPVGAMVDLAYGPAIQSVTGTLTDSSQMNVKQAVLRYKFENDFQLEAGRFVTHIGYELIESNDNWNYSRGLLFGFIDPFWHQGVKLTMPLSESFVATALVVNGWNNSYEFNGNKHLGAQLAWQATDATSLCLNLLTGQEPATVGQKGGETKSIYDFVASYVANEDLSLALNAAYLTFAAASGDVRTLGASVYLHYVLAPGWSITPRAEWVDDKDGFAFGGSFSGGQTMTSYTLTLEDKFAPGLAWRAEFRRDQSSKEPFTQSSWTSSVQETATVALIGSF